MKRFVILICISLLACYSCKKQTKTIVVNCTWSDNHFVYTDQEWYAVIAEETSSQIHALSYKQLTKLAQGTNSKISFDIEDSKAASHTIVIFNDSNNDKLFTSDDAIYTTQTVVVSTEKEIAIDMNVQY